ncbi:MAG: polymer-forming cytoskeletal protein, partial [Gammaproteobacteria bacterium]
MFEDKKRNGARQGGSLLMVLGESASLEGKFTIGDSIQIECEVAGEINVEGRLVIADKGIVRADVNTVDAV